MGKNKNYNYHADEEIIEELEAFEDEDILEEEPEVEEEYIPKVEPKIEPGYVIGCNQLNMRFEPNPDAVVVNVLKRDQMIMIYFDESTEEYYRARTEYGISGYVLKKYIEVG